jgi:hypothetical protein
MILIKYWKRLTKLEPRQLYQHTSDECSDICKEQGKITKYFDIQEETRNQGV